MTDREILLQILGILKKMYYGEKPDLNEKFQRQQENLEIEHRLLLEKFPHNIEDLG